MPLHVDLARSPRHARRLVLAAAALGLVAAGLAFLSIAGVGGGGSVVGRISLTVVVVALGALVVVLVRAARAPAGRLELDGDPLVLRHPQLLRTPISLPRSQVRTILVDPRPPIPVGGLAPELSPRFALVETGGDPAWLHPGARAALAYLGDPRTAPDGVVVLRSALRLGGAPRRLLAALVGNEELRALATCGGFFLELADPAAALDAVRAAGLDQPLTLAEAARLDDLAVDRGPFGRDR